MSRLEGKVAIVTGSSSGIGAATARMLAADGAHVVVNSSSSVEAGQAVADEVGGSYVQGDISDGAQARSIVGETIERQGRLDVLINNAGTTKVIPHHDLEALTPEVWHRILDVNVLGTWWVTQAAIPHLKASGAGCIVNVTSLAGVRATGSSIPYAVSKAALNHLTVLLANVVGPEVRVNAVAPGLVDTPWTADWDAIRETVRQRSPLGRSATADDVAELTMGLVRSTHVTGQVVVADGGMSIR